MSSVPDAFHPTFPYQLCCSISLRYLQSIYQYLHLAICRNALLQCICIMSIPSSSTANVDIIILDSFQSVMSDCKIVATVAPAVYVSCSNKCFDALHGSGISALYKKYVLSLLAAVLSPFSKICFIKFCCFRYTINFSG